MVIHGKVDKVISIREGECIDLGEAETGESTNCFTSRYVELLALLGGAESLLERSICLWGLFGRGEAAFQFQISLQL
jgi:hypothetical protein